jgi:hypothetical protein
MLRSQHASRATLASHLHAFGNRRKARLAITDPIDLYETIEADAHHAIRRPQRAGHRSRSQACHTSGEQCRSDRVAEAAIDITAFIAEADSNARRVNAPEH